MHTLSPHPVCVTRCNDFNRIDEKCTKAAQKKKSILLITSSLTNEFYVVSNDSFCRGTKIIKINMSNMSKNNTVKNERSVTKNPSTFWREFCLIARDGMYGNQTS